MSNGNKGKGKQEQKTPFLEKLGCVGVAMLVAGFVIINYPQYVIAGSIAVTVMGALWFFFFRKPVEIHHHYHSSNR